MEGLVIRRFGEGDSYEELTEFLHRAYASLAAMGLHFHATHQPAAVTKERAELGECYVAFLDGALAGTICLYTPGEHYGRDGAAKFGQYAVDPALQGRGIGRALLEFVEERGREMGAEELALDTSVGATHLIALYEKWGFRVVATCQWDAVNYESYIMVKPLTAPS